MCPCVQLREMQLKILTFEGWEARSPTKLYHHHNFGSDFKLRNSQGHIPGYEITTLLRNIDRKMKY